MKCGRKRTEGVNSRRDYEMESQENEGEEMLQRITTGFGKGVLWLWTGFLLLLSLGAFMSSALGGVVPLSAAGTQVKTSDARAGAAVHAGAGEQLEVHFLDVGQGDCTLLCCGDASMLIDTGADGNGTKIQNYLKKQGVSKLDYLVLTHPDADHIGSADVIVTKFEIGTLFVSAYTKENKTCERLAEAEQYRKLKPVTPSAGDSYTLGEAEVIFLSSGKKYDDPNNSSLALRVVLGETSFLFTGDCEEDAEKEILESGLCLKSDVYQVGHHGSKDASSKELLEAAAPDYAVISCAAENEYGHPHAQTLNNLRAMGVKLFRTDEQGTIAAVADGKKITFNCSDTKTWKAGESSLSGKKASVVQENAKEQAAAADASNAQEESLAAGSNFEEGAADAAGSNFGEAQGSQFILNRNSGVLHKSSCSHLPKEKNQLLFGTAEEAMASGLYDHKCSFCWYCS